MKPFIIKQNDTLPVLIIKVKTRGNMNQVIDFDLSGVTGSTFSMVDNCGNVKIYKQSATILCSSGGTLQYSWTTADTDESGKFLGEFELTYASSGKLSIPQMGGIDVEILKDISPF